MLSHAESVEGHVLFNRMSNGVQICGALSALQSFSNPSHEIVSLSVRTETSVLNERLTIVSHTKCSGTLDLLWII